MATTLVTGLLAAAEQAGPELPATPAEFGLAALVVFAALFGVTWAFRNVARKR